MHTNNDVTTTFEFDPDFLYSLSLLEPLSVDRVYPLLTDTTPRQRGRPRLDSMISGNRMDDSEGTSTTPIPTELQNTILKKFNMLVYNEDMSLTECYTYLAKKYGYTYNQIFNVIEKGYKVMGT
jgi:hypothetical protein